MRRRWVWWVVAVAAVAEIPEDQRPSLRIIGAPPPDGEAYARQLYEAITAAGMLSTSAYDGALRRTLLAERIRRASLVLVPSHSETFGLVALEAAASGVPVVASATGGLREAVVDGETGILLETDDPAVWSQVMMTLLQDDDMRQRLAANARAHALRHSWAASTRALLAGYGEVLSTSAS